MESSKTGCLDYFVLLLICTMSCRHVKSDFSFHIYQEMVEAIHTETQLIDDKVGVSVHASYGAFVLIIFCHGSEGYVNGSDGKHIKHTSLIDLLSARNFPAMRGKPKIVIFHLCDYGESFHLHTLLSGPIIKIVQGCQALIKCFVLIGNHKSTAF